MKITVQHIGIPSTHALNAWVERQILNLATRRHLDEAVVRLEHRYAESPAFAVHVHLVTPGPDVIASQRDHTIRAAFAKVLAELDEQISRLADKRERRRKSRMSAPAERARPLTAFARGRSTCRSK